MHKPLNAAMTCLAIVAVAGCGSTHTKSVSVSTGASVGASAPRAATKAQFVATADQICRALHAQQSPLNARAQALKEDTTATRRQLGALLGQSVTFAHAADTKLQTLPRPPEDATTVGKLVSGYEHEAADVTAYAQALTKREPEKQRFASGSLERTTASDRKLAESIGVKACANSE